MFWRIIVNFNYWIFIFNFTNIIGFEKHIVKK